MASIPIFRKEAINRIEASLGFSELTLTDPSTELEDEWKEKGKSTSEFSTMKKMAEAKIAGITAALKVYEVREQGITPYADAYKQKEFKLITQEKINFINTILQGKLNICLIKDLTVFLDNFFDIVIAADDESQDLLIEAYKLSLKAGKKDLSTTKCAAILKIGALFAKQSYNQTGLIPDLQDAHDTAQETARCSQCIEPETPGMRCNAHKAYFNPSEGHDTSMINDIVEGLEASFPLPILHSAWFGLSKSQKEDNDAMTKGFKDLLLANIRQYKDMEDTPVILSAKEYSSEDVIANFHQEHAAFLETTLKEADDLMKEINLAESDASYETVSVESK